MNRYCAAVVWYNPDDRCVQNIGTYCEEVEKVYIIDNSEDTSESIISHYKNQIEYIPLGNNYGIAYALNCACKKAIDDGFDYILTMDQDSRFEKNALKKMIVYSENHPNEYAIICPNVKSLYYDEESKEEKLAYVKIDPEVEIEQKWCMTSGSLLSLKSYMLTDGFDNKLFIAHVDIEFCFQLYLKKQKIIMIGGAILDQFFGNSKPRRILWKTVHPSFASPVRTYYLFRNHTYIKKKYGKRIEQFMGISLWKFVIKTVLFEDEKTEKIRMMMRGIKDGKKGELGAYSQQR